MVRFFFLFTISAFLTACNGWQTPDVQERNQGVVFPSKEYSRVVAYEFEDQQGNYIINKGQLNATVIDSVEMDAKQAKAVLAILNDPNTYGGTPTRCFIPRMGLVYYNAKNQPVGHVSICLQCDHLGAVPTIAASRATLDPSGNPRHGFSSEGRRKITELCRALNFAHCQESAAH